MDRLDKRLLNLLQQDASRTNADLADEVGLSPSSCLRRIRRLKNSGVIRRVVAVLDPRKLARPLKTIVTVEMKEHGEEHLRRFLALATSEPAVVQAHAVTGEIDVVLHFALKDMEEFDAICERLFRNDTNVSRFQTMVVLRTAKDGNAVPLEII